MQKQNVLKYAYLLCRKIVLRGGFQNHKQSGKPGGNSPEKYISLSFHELVVRVLMPQWACETSLQICRRISMLGGQYLEGGASQCDEGNLESLN
jgi:hypothetical protein